MRPNLRGSSLCEVSVCIGIEPERLEHADSVIKITAADTSKNWIFMRNQLNWPFFSASFSARV